MLLCFIWTPRGPRRPWDQRTNTKRTNQVTANDYCLEGEPHAWDLTGEECDCGDGMCRVECSECGATDYACEEN